MNRPAKEVPPGKAHAAIKALFHWMPLIFGVLFIAPLIAQSLELWELEAPFGISPLTFGLGIAAPWGLYAVLIGRWL